MRTLVALSLLAFACCGSGCYTVVVSGDKLVVKYNCLTGKTWVMGSSPGPDLTWVPIAHE